MRADRLRSLGEMAAGIAHELNQPLSGVRALAEQNLIAMRRKWAIDPEELHRLGICEVVAKPFLARTIAEVTDRVLKAP